MRFWSVFVEVVEVSGKKYQPEGRRREIAVSSWHRAWGIEEDRLVTRMSWRKTQSATFGRVNRCRGTKRRGLGSTPSRVLAAKQVRDRGNVSLKMTELNDVLGKLRRAVVNEGCWGALRVRRG